MRVFNLLKGDKLYTFKRGIHKTEVYWINFSHKSNLVVLSSTSGTIHLFKLDEGLSTSEKQPQYLFY